MELSEDKKYLLFKREEVKKVKKISGHAFVEMCGLSVFAAKGDSVLSLLGLYKKDVDKKYLNRGDFAEKIMQKVYSREHQIKVYNKKEVNYDNFKDNKYFGGLVDIELLDESAYVEVKSKSLSKYNDIEKLQPLDEIYQGLLYCVLGNKDKLYMEWVFFDPVAEEEIFNGKNPTSLKNIKKLSKTYNISDYKDEVKEKMQTAFNYYLTCYKEERIPVADLSEGCLKSLGLEIPNEPFDETLLPF